MKFIHKENYKNYIVALVSLVISAIAFPKLPEQIAVHFNVQGNADGFGSPLMVFMFPAIILLITVIGEFTKHVDPKASNYSVFSKHYYLFFLVINVFMLLVQLYVITYALELITFNVSNIITILVGVMFIIVGNLMPKIKQNYFMGIKTPWALADEQVWYATHRFGGKLWFILGIFMCICGFLPSYIVFSAILISALIAAFAPIIYSYIIYKRRA